MYSFSIGLQVSKLMSFLIDAGLFFHNSNSGLYRGGAIELLRSKCGQNNNGLLEKEVHDAFYAIKVACSCSICLQNLST